VWRDRLAITTLEVQGLPVAFNDCKETGDKRIKGRFVREDVLAEQSVSHIPKLGSKEVNMMEKIFGFRRIYARSR
jgi:hypothetical protein